MILILSLSAIAAGVYFLFSKGSTEVNIGSVFAVSNKMPLPDILPENQGGKYTRNFDDVFYNASQKWGVPFALIKAHARRESNFDPNAYRLENTGKASYGLMQILWWTNSNRFQKWGYPDDILRNGSLLYEPDVNCDIACQLILENWDRMGNLRDIINAYNTGVIESKRVAPGNYVDDVIDTYYKIAKVSNIA